MATYNTERQRLKVKGLGLCCVCKETKPLSEFSASLNGLGYEYRCKPCAADSFTRWRGANPERMAKHLKLANTKARLSVLYHYSGGTMRCACCSEPTYEFLSIDHMGGDGHRSPDYVSGQRLYRRLIEQSFPPGYQVLCHDCNMAKGFYGKCPHQKAPSYELCGAAI